VIDELNHVPRETICFCSISSLRRQLLDGKKIECAALCAGAGADMRLQERHGCVYAPSALATRTLREIIDWVMLC